MDPLCLSKEQLNGMDDQWTEQPPFMDLSLAARVKLLETYAMQYEVKRILVIDQDTFDYLNDNNQSVRHWDEASMFVKGTIKWDGCSHNNFGDVGYIHGCQREELTNIGELFNRLFDIANKLGVTDE